MTWDYEGETWLIPQRNTPRVVSPILEVVSSHHTFCISSFAATPPHGIRSYEFIILFFILFSLILLGKGAKQDLPWAHGVE
jgi:hypothetical protein